MKYVKWIVIGLFFGYMPFSLASHKAEHEDTHTIPQTASDGEHRVAAGLMVGGGSGVLGLLADINITPHMSATAFLGTGYTYYSMGAKTQYYLLGTVLSPFIGIGYAHWRSFRPIRNVDHLYPNFVFSTLLSEKQRESAKKDNLSLHMAYPTFGIQYIHESGFGVSTELMYLFDVTDFKGVPFFSVQTFYYF